MVAQQRAKRILAAWVAGSADGLKFELAGALNNSGRVQRVSAVENEEQELLESVASDLWISLERTHPSAGSRLQSDLSLLEHLSHRSAGDILNNSCAA
jgi:hypothetical protein